ncbi:MAG: hypothetical protein KKC68_06710, partial [Candidatus Thermoplasmatota archaeon]|nr:hypothetical protein [Candidatus Thermoplasmatota archaeon]
MKLKKLAELLGVELPEKKEILQPVPTAYRFGKNTAHGIWCYNQAKETYDNLDIPIERLLS